MPQAQLWIGLVELKPLNRRASGATGAFTNAAGAFTNIVTWAHDLQGFRRNADTVAATVGASVIDVQGAEPLSERAKRASFTEEIDEMVLRAESNPNAIIYGTFHTYPFDEA
jgi:hypothetical protein